MASKSICLVLKMHNVQSLSAVMQLVTAFLSLIYFASLFKKGTQDST